MYVFFLLNYQVYLMIWSDRPLIWFRSKDHLLDDFFFPRSHKKQPWKHTMILEHILEMLVVIAQLCCREKTSSDFTPCCFLECQHTRREILSFFFHFVVTLHGACHPFSSYNHGHSVCKCEYSLLNLVFSLQGIVVGILAIVLSKNKKSKGLVSITYVFLI